MSLTPYESLLSNIEKEKDLYIFEMEFKSSAKGLYQDNIIAINKNIETDSEKRCILAEEFAHHKKTYGNIQKLDNIENIKQEYKARLFAFETLVDIETLAIALTKNVSNISELSDELNVTEDFLLECLEVYKRKFGNKIIKTEYGKIIFYPNLTFFPYLKGVYNEQE